MGTCGSQGFHAVNHSDLYLLGLTKQDIASLLLSFHDIAKKKNAREMRKSDLLACCANSDNKEPMDNMFRARVFARFPAILDFHDFVFSVWDFCSLDEDGIKFFVFSIYKTVARSTTLTTADSRDILREAYGRAYRKDETIKSRRSIDLRGGVLCAVGYRLTDALEVVKFMDIDAFSAIAQGSTQLLLPALTFRDALRARVVGPEFWGKQEALRQLHFPSPWACAESIIRWKGDAARIDLEESDKAQYQVSSQSRKRSVMGAPMRAGQRILRRSSQSLLDMTQKLKGPPALEKSSSYIAELHQGIGRYTMAMVGKGRDTKSSSKAKKKPRQQVHPERCPTARAVDYVF